MPVLVIIAVVIGIALLVAFVVYVVFPVTVAASAVAVVVGFIMGAVVAARSIMQSEIPPGYWGKTPKLTPNEVRDGDGFESRFVDPARPNDWAWPSYFFVQFGADVSTIVESVTRVSALSYEIFKRRWSTWGDIWRWLLLPCFVVATVFSVVIWIVMFLFVFCGLPAYLIAQLARRIAIVVSGVRETYRIRSTGALAQCMEPGCYYASTSMTFMCPNRTCNAIHRDLGDPRLGVFARRCGCGTSLVVTPGAAGRDSRYRALCSRCEHPLEPGAGVNRGLLVAVIGDPSSGKTSLTSKGLRGMFAAFDKVRFPYDLANDSARGYAEESAKPGGGLPTPIAFALTGSRPTTVVHVLDAPGTYVENVEGISELSYLAHADGIVIVMSGTLLLGLAPSGSSGAGVEVVDRAIVFEKIVSRLRHSGINLKKTAAAIVITGLDQLVREGKARNADAGSTTAVATWLTSIGMGGVVRQSANEFASSHYFFVDAAGRMSAASSKSPSAVFFWVLGAIGMSLPAVAARPAAAPTEKETAAA